MVQRLAVEDWWLPPLARGLQRGRLERITEGADDLQCRTATLTATLRWPSGGFSGRDLDVLLE
eukprot:664291-Lingulodinium_polyedra.AAC.1